VAEKKLGTEKKQQNEKLMIRNSHQTDKVIKSEDIKTIIWDDFTLIHCSLKMYIKLFNLGANRFWGGPGLFFRWAEITKLKGYKWTEKQQDLN